MPKVHHYLRDQQSPKEKRKRVVYMIFRYGAKGEFPYSLKYKVAPIYWNEETQRVRNTTQVSNRAIINDEIKATADYVFIAHSSLLQQHGYVTNEMLREKMDVFLKRTEAPNRKVSLLDYYADYIKRRKKIEKPKTKGVQQTKSLDNYGYTLKNFTKYDKAAQKNNSAPGNEKMPRANWQHIDMDFYYAFITWMEKQDYSLNYIGSHIKNLLTILTQATKDGVNKNLAYEDDNFVKMSEEVDNIYLDEEELERIYDIEGLNDYDSRIRDFFLIGAFTGLRVSDFTTLDKSNFIVNHKGVELVYKENKKTGKTAYIPVHQVVKDILKRRDDVFPEPVCNTLINKRIKEIGRQAEILGKTTVTRTKGGEKLTTGRDKCDFICSHTARRSFATNTYLAGLPVEDIMTMTLHSTLKDFLNYIKITPIERAASIAMHPWWSGRAQMKKVS